MYEFILIFFYAISVWGCTYKFYLHKISILQVKLLGLLPKQNGIPGQTLHLPT